MNTVDLSAKIAETLGTPAYGTGGWLGRLTAGAVRAATAPVRALAGSAAVRAPIEGSELLRRAHPDLWGSAQSPETSRQTLGAPEVLRGENWKTAPGLLRRLLDPSGAAIRQLMSDVAAKNPQLAEELRFKAHTHGRALPAGTYASPSTEEAMAGGEKRRSFFNMLAGLLTPTTRAGTRSVVRGELFGTRSEPTSAMARPHREVAELLSRVRAGESGLPAEQRVLPRVEEALMGGKRREYTPLSKAQWRIHTKTGADLPTVPGAPKPMTGAPAIRQLTPPTPELKMPMPNPGLEGYVKGRLAPHLLQPRPSTARTEYAGVTPQFIPERSERQLEERKYHIGEVARGLSRALGQSRNVMASPHWQALAQHVDPAIGIALQAKGFAPVSVQHDKPVTFGIPSSSLAAVGYNANNVAAQHTPLPPAPHAEWSHRIQRALDAAVIPSGPDPQLSATRKIVQQAHLDVAKNDFANHNDYGVKVPLSHGTNQELHDLYEDVIKAHGIDTANALMHRALQAHKVMPGKIEAEPMRPGVPTTASGLHASRMLAETTARLAKTQQRARAERGEEGAGPTPQERRQQAREARKLIRFNIKKPPQAE